MSFNRAALSACPIQCRVAFVDRNGNQVTGVFFKGVFANYLTNNTAPLYIRGTVGREGNDYVMFLQKWW